MRLIVVPAQTRESKYSTKGVVDMSEGLRSSGFLARWNRELLSIAYAVVIGLLFTFSPKWHPSSNASGDQGMLIAGAFFLLFLFYFTWQAWPLVRGEVGTAFSQTTDAIFSSFPLFPVLIAFTLHFVGYYEQSFTNLFIATMTVAVVAFDILVFGGIGSLVNRLTHDMYMGKGRND